MYFGRQIKRTNLILLIQYKFLIFVTFHKLVHIITFYSIIGIYILHLEQLN